MSKQSEKYHLNLAGEYFVAAELQRRGIHSSITYGNAKKSDVIAFSESGDKAVAIEVKSTSRPSWVVGGSIPAESNRHWVFVNIPVDNSQPSSFYILTQAEIHNILSAKHKIFQISYRKRHGHDFNGKGVYSLLRSEIEACRDNWVPITKFIKAT